MGTHHVDGTARLGRLRDWMMAEMAVHGGLVVRRDHRIGIALMNPADHRRPRPDRRTVVPDIPRSRFKEIRENAVSRTQLGDTPGGAGRFAQVAGFSFAWSRSGTAQELDGDGNVTVAGTRVLDVVLDDGTPIVLGGAVVSGPPVGIAIVDFLARGGDQYPFRGASFTAIGVSYQQALPNYIQGPLGGLISTADHPEAARDATSSFPDSVFGQMAGASSGAPRCPGSRSEPHEPGSRPRRRAPGPRDTGHSAGPRCSL